MYIPSVTEEDDSSPPTVSNCPESSEYAIPFGLTSRVVTWSEPTATDDSGMEPTVTQTHLPSDSFPVGTTQVIYTFMDRAGNIAMCSFQITGNDPCISYLFDNVYLGVALFSD